MCVSVACLRRSGVVRGCRMRATMLESSRLWCRMATTWGRGACVLAWCVLGGSWHAGACQPYGLARAHSAGRPSIGAKGCTSACVAGTVPVPMR